MTVNADPTYKQARYFDLSHGTRYIENPDGSWTNLTSETVWPVEYMRVHFPWVFADDECTCDLHANYNGSICDCCKRQGWQRVCNPSHVEVDF